jgi:dihydrofolate reductase
MIVSILVAVAENNVIGKDNKLIWHLPADLQFFKKLTMGKTIVMGRKTFESIGRPLPGRQSVIITRQKDYLADGCIVVHSLEEAFTKIENRDEVFIIGGAQIFEQALDLANRIYFTRIHHSFEGDTFFPALDEQTWETTKVENFAADETNKFNYSFFQYVRRPV